MRQIYHRQNNKRRRKSYTSIFVVIIFVTIIELSFHPILMAGKSMSNIVSSPFDSIGKGITSIFKVATGRSGDLLEENSELRNEIDRLNREIRARDLLRSENEALREIYDIKGNDVIDFIVTEIVARPPKTIYDTLKINKGYKDGVIEGRKVYANEYYIGVVESSDTLQSTVAMIGNDGDVTVVIGDSEGVLISLKGLSFVGEFSSTSEIEVGDTVVLVDDMDEPFGVVSHIEKTESDPSIKVYVNVPIQLSSLRYVSVEK